MEDELVQFWTYWYREENNLRVPKNVRELAKYVAIAVNKYQQQEIPWKKNWGPQQHIAKLPIGIDAHLIVGSMAISESHLDPKIVGSRGEAGLLQCHPQWCIPAIAPGLSKISKEERTKLVRGNTELGIDLGVGFLAKSVGWCGKHINKIDDWIYPVSIYSAGTKAFDHRGRCVGIQVARDRVNRAKRIGSEIRRSHRLPLLAKILFDIRQLI